MLNIIEMFDDDSGRVPGGRKRLPVWTEQEGAEAWAGSLRICSTTSGQGTEGSWKSRASFLWGRWATGGGQQ